MKIKEDKIINFFNNTELEELKSIILESIGFAEIAGGFEPRISHREYKKVLIYEIHKILDTLKNDENHYQEKEYKTFLSNFSKIIEIKLLDNLEENSKIFFDIYINNKVE